jgi:flagellar protein FlgJ
MEAGTGIYTDLGGLARLRSQALSRRDDPETIRAVASEFEAVFLHLVLSAMREDGIEGGLFDSAESAHYRDMLDGQLALTLARGRGVGLAEVLAAQLQDGRGAAAPVAAPGAPAGSDSEAAGPSPDFVGVLLPHAVAAGRRLEVDPRGILAQAMLETGWGRSRIRHDDGRDSFNVFGIKAGPGWGGDRVVRGTVEFEDGVMVQRREAFRAYTSYAEAFEDYVNLLGGRRYQPVRAAGADPVQFAAALQESRYATDPQYGAKLESLLRSDRFEVALADAAMNPTEERHGHR